ncbi:MAG: hypothetical protein ACJAT3_002162 [Akkermansiaceae bacterium]
MKVLFRKGLPAAAVAATTAITVTTTTTAIIVTATAATTITTTTTTTATTATTATAVLLWATLFGFVYAEITTLEVGSVHFFDGFTSKVVVSQSDEGESAWAVGFAIEGDE